MCHTRNRYCTLHKVVVDLFEQCFVFVACGRCTLNRKGERQINYDSYNLLVRITLQCSYEPWKTQEVPNGILQTCFLGLESIAFGSRKVMGNEN